MARADIVLIKRPDIYVQSFLTAIGVFLLANRVESIYTLADISRADSLITNHGNCLLRDANTLGRSKRSPRITYRIKTRETS